MTLLEILITISLLVIICITGVWFDSSMYYFAVHTLEQTETNSQTYIQDLIILAHDAP